jgi:tetratricopeptide (TPR) repeat protein
MKKVASRRTAVKQVDRVQGIKPLAELLKSRSSEDLVKLIEKMLLQAPDLLPLVEAMSVNGAGQGLNLSGYQKQACWVLGLDKMRDIAQGLQSIVDEVQNLVDSGNWQDGGRLYQMLLQESIDSYDWNLLEIDYDGDVCCVIGTMVEGLTACLEQAEGWDAQIRETWLRTLLAGEMKDIELGGRDFAYGSWSAIVEWATVEDWDWLEESIRSQLSQVQSGDWARQVLVRMLSDRLKALGETEALGELIQELGTPEQKVFFLVKQGEFDGAIALAQKSFSTLPGLVIRFADALLAVVPEKALQYMLGEVEKSQNGWHYRQWLGAYYATHGDTESAIEWELKQFRDSPSLELYLTLKRLSGELGNWDTFQEEVLEILDSKKDVPVAIQVAVVEEDFDRAIALLNQPNLYNWQEHYLAVALAGEKKKPEMAIKLYQTVVTTLILNKNRSAYKQATKHLQRIRSLYDGMGMESSWMSYIKQFKNSYPTLRALQEELQKAKLL